MAALLGALVAVECSAKQTSVPKPTAKKIIVQLLNGKNGKPIKDERPNIWLGNLKDDILQWTDSKGEILLEIDRAQPREIRVRGNSYVDCPTPCLNHCSLPQVVQLGPRHPA